MLWSLNETALAGVESSEGSVSVDRRSRGGLRWIGGSFAVCMACLAFDVRLQQLTNDNEPLPVVTYCDAADFVVLISPFSASLSPFRLKFLHQVADINQVSTSLVLSHF